MTTRTSMVALPAAIALALLAGCGSISAVQKERVAAADSAVQQAAATIGSSEAGALDLQRAKDTLAQAKQAVAKKDGDVAERLANLAQLDAQLAVAKTQKAGARRAADEVLASIQQLRQESGLTKPATR